MIPVVVLTSSNEERDLVRSYKLGVNAYVTKPVDFHEFVNALWKLRMHSTIFARSRSHNKSELKISSETFPMERRFSSEEVTILIA